MIFNKKTLVLAVSALSLNAQAELKMLDDSMMGELTGQAGLTIDLETKYTIGEFMYKDAGSVFLKGISLGANANDVAAFGANAGAGNQGYVDNIRIKLDIAGSGADDSSADEIAAGITSLDNKLATGFSGYRSVADFQNEFTADTKLTAMAAGGNDGVNQLTTADVAAATGLSANAFAGTAGNTDLTIGDKKTYDDGDLLIHVSFKDAWQKAGGLAEIVASDAISALSFDDVVTSAVKGKDFTFGIDAVGLAGSEFAAGDSLSRATAGHTATGVDADATADASGTNGSQTTTTLISDLTVSGYLGPVDIHIENNGNGFGGGVGVGDADSKINWNTYFNITDLDVYLDSWDGLAGMKIDDMKINNVRGDVTDIDGNFAFGFAQSKREIYAVRNAAGMNQLKLLGAIQGGAYAPGTGTAVDVLNIAGVDGVAINTHFKGDQEIGALSFGDTGESIGQLYWTDIESHTNRTISAH